MRDAGSDRRQRERDRGARGGTIASFPAQHQWAGPVRVRLGEAPQRSHNLPAPLTSFVGRERELAAVRRRLGETRLLTLTGAGGIGKTRLALEVAVGLIGSYPDGVWLTELAALADPTLVPRAVASALCVPEQPGCPLTETLADYLASRSLLLVLDNCEHLVEACAGLAEALLRTSPGLQILVTSRHALNAAGETTWLVPSLSLPTIDDGRPTTERLSSVVGRPSSIVGEAEAVRLFVDRARAAQPSFDLADDNAAAVSQICARLDGIPLAIELAAARVRVLAPPQIAARLDDRFRLLTAGSSTALPRQQTLRGTMDWSYQLLSDPERVLLRRLAVFAGGWTLEAAEAVCDGVERRERRDESEEPRPLSSLVSPLSTLDVLTGLVDKSLVLVGEHDGEARYNLLETVRQYADEKLRESGEEEAVRGRHADWFLALAERARPELIGPAQATWLDRLEREHDNLRAALGWLRQTGQAERGLRLGWALWRFWQVRGHLAEGRASLAELLALEGASGRTRPRAEVVFGAGRLAYAQGDYTAARPLFEDSLAISREIGYAEHVAASLTQLGHIARAEGAYAAARSLYEQGLAIRRELGDDQTIAITLLSMGTVAHLQGDYPEAAARYEEGLALATVVGDRWHVAHGLTALGELALDRGNQSEADARFAESLALAREAGEPSQIAGALEGLAGLAASESRPERALYLAGAAAALRDEIGALLPPAEHALLNRRLAPARQALDERVCAESWAVGRAMPPEQAIEYALASGPDRPPMSALQAPGATDETTLAEVAGAPQSLVLTRREREVVALIARGLTNRRIAAELVVSEWTIDSHVRHILNKLGFATRAQVAAWAVEHGLAAPRT